MKCACVFFSASQQSGREDGGEQETQQQLAKPHRAGTGGWCSPVTDTLSFLNQALPR